MNMFDKFTSDMTPLSSTNFSYQSPLVSMKDVKRDAKAFGIKAQTKTRIVFYNIIRLVLYPKALTKRKGFVFIVKIYTSF